MAQGVLGVQEVSAFLIVLVIRDDLLFHASQVAQEALYAAPFHVSGSSDWAAFRLVGRFLAQLVFVQFDIVDTRQLTSYASVALLSVFLVLYLWMLWAYVKVNATYPQLGIDFVDLLVPSGRVNTTGFRERCGSYHSTCL
jgi:hypothetical protein